MAYAILRAEIPDDDPEIAEVGISHLAKALADDAAAGYTGWTSVEVIEVDGPDTPKSCWGCGCDPHKPKPCPTCSHPFCQAEEAGS